MPLAIVHASGVLRVGKIHDFNFAAAANKHHPSVRLHLSYSFQSFLSLAVQPFSTEFARGNFPVLTSGSISKPYPDLVSGLQFPNSLASKLASLFVLLSDRDGLHKQKDG